MAMTLDSDIRAMANRLLNTRPDASAAEALRKAAGMLIDLANERAKAQPAQAVEVKVTGWLPSHRAVEVRFADTFPAWVCEPGANVIISPAPPSNSPTTGAIGDNVNG